MAVRDELVKDVGAFCPAEANIVQDTGYDFEALAQEAIDLMNQLGDFVSVNIIEFRQALSTARQTTDDLDNIAHKFDVHDWQSVIIIIL
jgi:flagellar biosynthesis/type III secretory pathway M-ring protein FliF/YscJ